MEEQKAAILGWFAQVMDLKLMSWNMQGSNMAEKTHTIRRLVRKFKPSIVGLQEIKRSMVSFATSRLFWGNQSHKWVFIPTSGLSGGLLLLWNADTVRVHDILQGTFSVSILCSTVGSDLKWVCCNVYGPYEPRDKVKFWNEIRDAGTIWGVPWIVFGDFNATRCQSERSSETCAKKVARDFNCLVDDLGLCEFDRAGPNFTYSNNSSLPISSRLDRFLANTDWMELFLSMIEKSLNFYNYDHRVLIL